MLIKTISFEIHDFTTHTTEEFLVEDTNHNYELIQSDPHTRNIRFSKTFEGEYKREMNIPLHYIPLQVWVALINKRPELFAEITPVAETV